MKSLRDLIDEYAERYSNATAAGGVGSAYVYNLREAEIIGDEIDRRLAAIEQFMGTEATKIKNILRTGTPDGVPPLKGSTSCRLCGHWLEGDWNRSDDDTERAELQRQMDAGRCDACTAKEITS